MEKYYLKNGVQRRLGCILSKCISLFNKIQLDYFLVSGSLLGCVRIGGAYPWDDDVDVGVFDLETLLSLKDEFNKVGLDLIVVNKYLVKIFEINGYRKEKVNYWLEEIKEVLCRNKNINRCEAMKLASLSYTPKKPKYYTYPFLDVKIAFNDGGCCSFLNPYWKGELYYPLKTVSFFVGDKPLMVKIPNKPEEYLELCYPHNKNQVMVITNKHSRQKSKRIIFPKCFYNLISYFN